MARLAILAGTGRLPVELALECPEALRVGFEGVETALDGPVERHRFEELGALFGALKAQGVTEVVLAGAMSRPPLDPARFDAYMQATAPRLMQAMQAGDDGLLRFVISLFEEQGLAVRGAHEVAPALAAGEGLLTGPQPEERALADADRAAAILSALAPHDVGQGAVVAGGLCLGIETLQGTDAMLRFVAETPQALRRGGGGVLVKRPKPGQDLRADMPAIGPDTIARATEAGLSGVVLEAGRVLILDREATLEAAEAAGLFLLGRSFG